VWSLKKKCGGQTILELFFVLLGLTSFIGFSIFLFAVFDISQKQTALTRTQAFMELGNYSDYGYQTHGDDDIDDDRSQVRFFLGENAPGTRVDLNTLKDFQDAVGGELDLAGGGGSRDESFWLDFAFPRAITRIGSDLIFSVKAPSSQGLRMTLYEEYFIAHNRSLKLDQDVGDNRLPTHFYSGSTHFQQWQHFSQLELPVGTGMVDNTDIALDALAQIVRADPSLSQEADRVARSVRSADGLIGGAQAALISTAISLAMQFGMEAIGNAIGSAADAAAGGAVDAAGGGGLDVAGQGFQFPGFSAPNFIDGATLHNIGQGFTFAGSLMTTANLGLALAGKGNENLMMATNIVGGVGGMFAGLAQLETFGSGLFDGATGMQLQGAGMRSDLFGGLSRVAGGAGMIVNQFDPDVGRALGIASSGLGIASSAFGISENFAPRLDSEGNWASYQGYTFDSESGTFQQTWVDGGQWRLTQDIGGLVSQTGGLVSNLSDSDAGLALTTLGGGISAVGGAGLMSYRLENNYYDGEAFRLMTDVGGLVSSVSGVGVGVSQLAGDEQMAQNFGYGVTMGGAIGMAGGAGMLIQGLAEGDFETGGEQLMAVGGAIAGVSGVGGVVASMAGQDDLATAFGYGAMAGGGIATMGAIGVLGGEIGKWMENRKQQRLGRDDAQGLISQMGDRPHELQQVMAGHGGANILAATGDIESPAYNRGLQSEIGNYLSSNHPEIFSSMDAMGAAGPQENRPWDTQRWNEAAGQIASANETIQSGLQAALSIQGVIDTSGGQAHQDYLIASSMGTAAQEGQGRVSTIANNFAGLQPPSSLSPQEQQLWNTHYEVSRAAMQHLEESLARGERPDRRVMEEGRQAAEDLESMIVRSRDRRQWEGFFDQYFELENLAAAERAARLNFRREVEALSLLMQAERHLVGKQVVATSRERKEIEALGKRHSRKLKEYRSTLQNPDPSFRARLQAAEHAWSRPRFITPKTALQQIDKTVQEVESRYQEMKHALVSIAER